MWNFFTQLKIYIFPIYYRILNKKNLSIYFEKKIQPRCFDIREKFLFNNRYLKFFYSKLHNMSWKLKKNFFMKPNNLLKFFVNFFTQLKIYIFPIYYSILNKKKLSIYFEKKIELDASIFVKKFCSIIGILKKIFILNCIIRWEN